MGGGSISLGIIPKKTVFLLLPSEWVLRLLSKKKPIKCAFYVSLPFFLCHNCAYLFVAVCIHITYIISRRLKASNNRAQSKYSTVLNCPGGNLQ